MHKFSALKYLVYGQNNYLTVTFGCHLLLQDVKILKKKKEIEKKNESHYAVQIQKDVLYHCGRTEYKITLLQNVVMLQHFDVFCSVIFLI